MPLVSVNIVTHNNETTIDLAIQSVLEQDFSDLCIVVVDNGSTDSTQECLEKFPVYIVANQKNKGYAAAHNQALGENESKYVLTLNPDVWLAPEFVTSLFDALEKHPEVGSASGRLLRVNDLRETPTHIDSAGVFMRRNRRQGLRYENMPIEQTPYDVQYIFGPDGAAAFYRREMLKDIAIEGEIFDEDFFLHKEDIDICWRAKLRGWQSIFVPEATAHHIRTFRPGKRQQLPNQLCFYGVRNRYLLLLKNEIPGHYLRDIPFILLYDLGVLLYIFVKERRSFPALISAWQLRSKMCQKRAVIQSRRNADAGQIAKWFI